MSNRRPADPAVDERWATTDDVPGLGALMFLAPSKEAVKLAGSAAAAERFRNALLERALATGTSRVIVLEDGGELVGFAEVTSGGDVPPLRVVAPLAIRSMGVVGAVRSAVRSSTRLKVDIAAPAGGLHLLELQVAPSRRNQGLGARLLAAIDTEAERLGVPHISLTTALDNPARHLYERHGYVVTAEKRDARYERATGSPGRILMVKDRREPD